MEKHCSLSRMDDIETVLLLELRPMFFKSAVEYTKEIESAIVDGDIERVGYYAHKLYGASATVGAKNIAANAERIDLGISRGEIEMEEIETLTSALEGYLYEYDKCLEKYLKKRKDL